MRSIKTFGLTALAAVMAMALVGASAMAAENTQLCSVHEEPCTSNKIASAHFVNVGSPELLGLAFGVHFTILCLESLANGTVGALGTAPTPQVVTLTSLTFAKCGTNTKHDNCTVTTLNLPKFDVLKTALNLGTAVALDGMVLVFCNLGGIGNVHCDYGAHEIGPFALEGALHTAGAGHGMLKVNALVIPVLENLETGVCPLESKFTALYEPLVHTYITG